MELGRWESEEKGGFQHLGTNYQVNVMLYLPVNLIAFEMLVNFSLLLRR